MFKPLNFKYIYIVAIFLAVGCAKESLSPDQTDAVLALSHIDNPETPDPDPEVDCKCYMSITGAEWDGDFPFYGIGLIDATPTSVPLSQQFEVNVHQSGGILGWATGSSMGAQYPLPSPFFELNPPSNGWHSFKLMGWGQRVTIHTTVKCYLQKGDGSQTLATTTYHSFSSPENPDPWYDLLPPRQFSCLYLTDQGQTPKD